MKEPARIHLGQLPTPLHPMERLTRALGGPDIWIKRDDATGLATGGNKTRKLELLLADALAKDADVVLTVGAAQSNHCRQTAAAAAVSGLDCVLVLRGSSPPRDSWTGNLLLDDLLGARVWWADDQDPLDVLQLAAEAQRAEGRMPYVIPYGGSNPIGAAAYALAFEEFSDQASALGQRFDWIVFASSSGGTQAGLVVGAAACHYSGRVLGISVDKTGGHLRQAVEGLVEPTADYLGLDLSIDDSEIAIDDGYVGGGYGVLTNTEREAIRLLARSEGILLDPVYTGKAMAGLLDLVRTEAISARSRVLFWHTGGMPALFAYASGLAEP